MRLRRLLALAAALVLPAAFSPVAADELVAVYQAILDDPTNSELNLQYALIAEGRGEYRKALAAYERILANDPDNRTAKAGLMRVRRIIQPPITEVFAETGVTYDTNAFDVANNAQDEVLGYINARLRDERTFGTTRWRTVATAYGEGHAEFNDLNTALATVSTGPIYDLGTSLYNVHPAVGGAAAYYDHHFYYAEANLSATFEGYLGGARQWARIRGGYRDYDSFFTSDAGFYADLVGTWTWPRIFDDHDVFLISPWLRWSGIDGAIPEGPFNLLSPGRYFAGGARFEYDRRIVDWLTLGIFVGVSNRLYETDRAPDGSQRNDFLVSPGVTLLFNDVFGRHTDLRLTYQYEHNQSNDPESEYVNHAVTLAIVARR